MRIQGAVISLLVFCLTACKNQTETQEIPKTSKPNILLIVADDMGFSDVAPFGGEIETPNISKLAADGIRFSGFHVLPTCSPTRSAMLTGNDNHVAGLGIMHEATYPALEALNLPGYSGHLSDETATIPELLRENGYHTYMTGKWHLGEGKGHDPYDRGFEETFILGTGGGSHFNDKKALAPPQHMDYTRNGVSVELPEDFYSSRNYTDSMIQFVDRNKGDKKPFFGFLSYTAVHDPLQAPKEYIDKYKGKFDMGWDSLFMMRLNNLKSLGIVSKNIEKFSRNPNLPRWNKLKPKQRHELARDMEVYAAMLDYMDMSIGRVFDYLKQQGMYENTVFIFMSDNGANGAAATSYPGNEDGKYLSTFNNADSNRGLRNSYIETGPGWAEASSAPFRFFKGVTTEGGIRAPLIIKMPGQMKNANSWNSSFFHVTDLMPTILEIAGAKYPEQFKGNKLHPLIGKSMLGVLNGDSASVHLNEGMGWELFEMKAYIKGQWKILRLPIPFGSGDWQLYDLSADPAETTDLSKEHPEIRDELIKAWNDYAKQNALHDHKGHYDTVYRNIQAIAKKNRH